MAINRKLLNISTEFFVFLALFFFVHVKTHAEGATIVISPNSGTYAVGQTFTVHVAIDGGGYDFNAAKASVLVSPALSIESVTLGDCNFAFVKTPAQSDPSFAGVILGGSTKNCTVYTLVVKAATEGKGTITFVNSSIKAYQSAVEILTSLQNATYVVTKGTQEQTIISPSPVEIPQSGPNGIKLYNIVFTISQPQDLPLAGMYVVLDPNLPSQKSAIPSLASPILAPTTNFGNVRFDEVPQGTHTIATYYNNRLLSKQIIYVAGVNRTLVLGVSTQKLSLPWKLIITVVSAMITSILVSMLIFYFSQKNNAKAITLQGEAFTPTNHE